MEWKLPQKISKQAASKLGDFPDLVSQLLSNRGITTSDEADKFFNIDMAHFNDPFLLHDIEKAIHRIEKAKKNKEKVFIYGDYDVDGIVATSIMWDFLYRRMGVDVLPYIPSRFDEGYGMSKKGLESIMAQGASLIITVDCGVKDIELVKEFEAKGLDFIITDHHTIDTDKEGNPLLSKEAIAVIHPRHPEGKYPFPDICGSAVAWKFIVAITKKLKVDFDPFEYIDLVSLATVTDIMPLVNENRAILFFGLKKIRQTSNLGLKTLMEQSGIENNQIDPYHYGFVIGPKLNAAGRIAHALLGVKLLSTRSKETADKYAHELTMLNQERQRLTEQMLQQAREAIKNSDPNAKIYVVWEKGWPEGIVGLVAGKLQDEFHKPVLIMSLSEGKAVGSARSIPNFNITEALSKHSDLLERFGGHAAAAGFTVVEENLETFKSALTETAGEVITDSDLVKKLDLDSEMTLPDISHEIIDWFEKFKPYGYMNKTPLFLLKDITLYNKKIIGRDFNHVKLSTKQGDNYFDIIAFNKADQMKDISTGDKIDIAGNVEVNEWNGNKKFTIKLSDYKKK